MVISCCAVHIVNGQGCKVYITFYRIPLEAERRLRWIAAFNRKDWQPSKYSWICSEHFLQAKSVSANVIKVMEKGHEKKRKLESSKREAARALFDLSAENGPILDEAEDEATVSEKGNARDAMCPTDLTSEDVESLQCECQQLQDETFTLKDKLKSSDLFEQASFENKEKLKTFTRLHLFPVFWALVELVKPALKDSTHDTLLTATIDIDATQASSVSCILGYLFHVHCSTASRVFINVINILNDVLVPACMVWPEREDVKISMPMCFRKSFKNCVSVIDCFEIKAEKSKGYEARAKTYSQYKYCNSMKYLIGITPQGVISFISKGWGGGQQIKRLGTTDVERVIGQARSKHSMLKGPVPISLLMTSSEAEYTTMDKIVRVACSLTNLRPTVVPID
uniref:THAP-type domain-containing protein n=1 Tax=Sphaeramia orbicularis TaxID=375764 RepID=A0A672Z375_9TELE